MKKIKSEELLSKFQYQQRNDEELEQVTGGSGDMSLSCYEECYRKVRQDNNGEALQQCLLNCLQ